MVVARKEGRARKGAELARREGTRATSEGEKGASGVRRPVAACCVDVYMEAAWLAVGRRVEDGLARKATSSCLLVGRPGELEEGLSRRTETVWGAIGWEEKMPGQLVDANALIVVAGQI